MFRQGDRVTGAPGRLSHGWHGVIERVVAPTKQKPEISYRVWWEERANWPEGALNWRAIRKTPTIHMMGDQLRPANAIEHPQSSYDWGEQNDGDDDDIQDWEHWEESA
jgi:hypothetical protein